MYSVILCGGSGTRLWPLSRKNFPKQFLSLVNSYSLLQGTFLRAAKTTPIEKIFLVTNKENYFNALNQIKELSRKFPKENILIEPESRNTAPAMILAAKYLAEITKINPEEPIIFLPADHYIEDEDKYAQTIISSAQSSQNQISTIGIKPTEAHTGYGYIKKGDYRNNNYIVSEFKEKPNLAIAQEYLNSNNFLWNVGIYIFNIRTITQELANIQDIFYDAFRQDINSLINNFSKLPATSFDFAVSEKSKNMLVTEGNFFWSDIGSFDNLIKTSSRLKTKPLSIDSKNVHAISTSNKKVTFSGVENLIVVENKDSILVCKQGESEKIKKIVEELEKEDSKELHDNLLVHRPWGKFEVLIDDQNHKVKKITVYPGEKLSLQYHYHRVEHWIVVRGVANIVNGEKQVLLKENESTFIPANTMHRLENPGKINLEIIEVQTGNYLEEDDIIRIEDQYNRG